jgi:hypothetical protein
MSNSKLVKLDTNVPKKVKVWEVSKQHLSRISFLRMRSNLLGLQARFKDNLSIVLSKTGTLVIHANNPLDETILDSFIKNRTPNVKPRLVHLHNLC